MWPFLIVFVCFSFVYSVCNLSIAESRKILLSGILFFSLFSFIIHLFTIQENNQLLIKILEQPEIISVVSIIQIAESLLMIFLSLEQIKTHYLNKGRKIFQWLSAFPSVIFLASLYFIQVYAMLYIENSSFTTIALVFSAIVAALLTTSVLLFKKIIPQWEIRTELKMLVSLMQVLLAMFLPLILSKKQMVVDTNFDIELTSLTTCFGIIIVFSFWGFISYKLNIKIKLWERLITLFIG